MVNLKDLQKTRDLQGIYFLYNENKELIYIGQSRNIYIRLLEHTVENLKNFKYFKFVCIKDCDFMELFEIYLIGLYKDSNKLLNRLILNQDFKNFFMHIPSSIRIKYDYLDFIDNYKKIEFFISDKNSFNCKYKTNKEIIEDAFLKSILDEEVK